jgi:hypothetical protein
MARDLASIPRPFESKKLPEDTLHAYFRLLLGSNRPRFMAGAEFEQLIPA